MAHGAPDATPRRAARRGRSRSTARALRGRPLRPLRSLPRLLPDLLRAGDGDGLAARAHLPHQVARRGPDRPDRLDGATSRPLSRVPRVRDGVPLRRALWPAHRDGAGGDRAAAARRRSSAALPLDQLLAPAAPSARLVARGRRPALLPGRAAFSASRARAGCSGSCRDRSRRGSPAAHAAGGGRPRTAARAHRRRRAERATVGLLTGCIQQVAFGPQNRATARVLAKNGVEVLAPRAQSCCGALHAHAGEHETALDLARRPSRPSRRPASSGWS